jgi:hypothetical protein
MKHLLYGTAAIGLLLGLPSAANANLIADGITYSLAETATANPLVEQYTLTITGINGAADTEGGRSGINAIAFNPPANFVSASMVTPPTGYTFVVGGLNSGGCDGNGNFFCFDNTSIPPTPATAFAANSSQTFVMDVTTSAAFVANTPAFKIDWVGSKNNYDLVSLPLPPDGVGPPPPPPPPPVPEPGTLALFGSMLLGMAGVTSWRRRRG